jgi:hypothetical protein
MKRAAISKLVLALALGLALPFDQAMCAPAGAGVRAAVCARPCCRTHSTCPMSRAGHATRACECRIAPSATLPALGAPSAPSTFSTLYAAVIARPVAPPNSIRRGIVPRSSPGSPPLPAAFGAHRLRAPPVSA